MQNVKITNYFPLFDKIFVKVYYIQVKKIERR